MDRAIPSHFNFIFCSFIPSFYLDINMGNSNSSTQGSRLTSTNTSGNPRNRNRHGKLVLKEHKRHGVVVVKVNVGAANRRGGDNPLTHVITPKGAIIFGNHLNPTGMLRAIRTSGLAMLTPGEFPIPDSRANRLLVTYCRGWHLIPFPEVFSRHSGTCFVVGDRNNAGAPFQIKVGDCFRLGSVGLVVSEMKLVDQEERRIDSKTLQFLKDEALAFDSNEDLAGLASDEIEEENESVGKGRTLSAVSENDLISIGEGGNEQNILEGNDKNGGKVDEATINMNTGGIVNGERYFCYMCYEMHNTPEDPLIAPCDCKGDTRYLHVQCLQKWYHSTALGSHSQVIRTTGNGAPACKICGSAYKTNFRRADGKKASILELENNGPYLSLVVVTHHDTNPGLFNTKFRLNFGRVQAAQSLAEEDFNSIVIGRSSSCAMILDYRTVSTIHAKISFINGKFYLSDSRSSNGTLVYIQDPLFLPYAQPVKVRMGRTTITLQAKRSWTAAMRSFLFGPMPIEEQREIVEVSSTTPEENVDYSNCLDPTPADLQGMIAMLNNDLIEKGDGQGGEAPTMPHNFLNARSFTLRTMNDAASGNGDAGFDDTADRQELDEGNAQRSHTFGHGLILDRENIPPTTRAGHGEANIAEAFSRLGASSPPIRVEHQFHSPGSESMSASSPNNYNQHEKLTKIDSRGSPAPTHKELTLMDGSVAYIASSPVQYKTFTSQSMNSYPRENNINHLTSPNDVVESMEGSSNSSSKQDGFVKNSPMTIRRGGSNTGSSPSIIVHSSMEESALFPLSRDEMVSQQAAAVAAHRDPQSDIFNSLPAAGIYAIPSSGSNRERRPRSGGSRDSRESRSISPNNGNSSNDSVAEDHQTLLSEGIAAVADNDMLDVREGELFDQLAAHERTEPEPNPSAYEEVKEYEGHS